MKNERSPEANADDEARLAAQAETLERAKEDAAAAKVQMETEVRDRILGQGRGRKNGIS